MGKHVLLLAAPTLVLLLASLSPAWSSEEEVVRDTNGDPLEVGSEYVIQSVKNGWYGPPIVSSGRRDFSTLSCPQYPIVSPTTSTRGQPLMFIPVDETDTQLIHLSSPLMIDSGFSAYCRSDGLWKVTLDALTRRDVIIFAGDFGAPPATFKIELEPVVGPLRIAYKISLVGQQGSEQDVTAFQDRLSKLKLLGLTDGISSQPLYVLFVKYHRNEVRSTVALE